MDRGRGERSVWPAQFSAQCAPCSRASSSPRSTAAPSVLMRNTGSHLAPRLSSAETSSEVSLRQKKAPIAETWETLSRGTDGVPLTEAIASGMLDRVR